MINLSQHVKVLASIRSGNWAFLWMRFSEDVAKDGHTCCVKKRYKRGGVVWTRYRTNKRECWNASLCIILNCKDSWFQILQNALNWLQVLLSASFQILYCTFHSFDMFQTFWRNPVETYVSQMANSCSRDIQDSWDVGRTTSGALATF